MGDSAMTNPTKRATKKLTSLLTIVLSGILLLPAFVTESAHAADPVFTTSDNGNGTVTVTGCTDCPYDVVIPDTISGKAVTDIGTAAFFKQDLDSVSIPDSVISIGPLAFNTNSLHSLVLPNSVTSIGAGAFAGNSLGYLGSVTLSNRLTDIGTGAFAVNYLTSLTIPASVTKIGPSAFNKAFYTTGPSGVSDLSLTFLGNAPTIEAPILENSGLTAITVPDGAIGWGSTFSGIPVKYVSGGTPLAGPSPYPSPTAATVFNYNVNKDGGSVTITGCRAKCGATNLVIPATIYDDLEEVTLNVTAIAYAAFAYSPAKSVTIPNSVTSIDGYAFFQSQATSATLPTGITSISEGLFRSSQLTSLAIPSSVTEIGTFAFSSNMLTSLTIPSSVTTISDCAFYLNKLTSLTIPNSVKTIRRWAFAGNNLTDLTIPAYVNDIGDSAFRTNTLNTVTFLGNAPTVGDLVFNENPSLQFVIVPQGATGFGATFAGLAVKSIPGYKTGARVTGLAKVTKTLTAKPGTWTGTAPITYTYQWYNCKKSVKAVVKTGTVPSGCSAISGATKSTFKVTAKQKKAFIVVLVSAKNSAKTVKVVTSSVGAVK